MKKFTVSLISLVSIFSIIGCSNQGSGSSSGIKFDSKYEISASEAMELSDTLSEKLNGDTTYIADYTYNDKANKKSFEASYLSNYQEIHGDKIIRYFNFTYSEGSIKNNKNINASDEDFLKYIDVGNGLRMLYSYAEMIPASSHFYYDNVNIMIHVKYNSEDMNFEIKMIMDKKGFISKRETNGSYNGAKLNLFETVSYRVK